MYIFIYFACNLTFFSTVPVLKDMNVDPSLELVSMISGGSGSAFSSTLYPCGSHQSLCPSIVLYLVITKDVTSKDLIHVLDIMDRVMTDECLPIELRKLLFLQVSVLFTYTYVHT